MAKKISSSDLFSQEDLFKGVRDSAHSALVMINQLNAAMKTSAEGLKASIKGADLGSAAGLKGFNQAATEANQLKEEAIRLEIMQKKLTAEMEAAEKSRIATERERLKLENDLAKAAARAAKSDADKDSAYKALVKSTRDLKNASKELAAQLLVLEKSGQSGTDEFKNLSKQYDDVTKSASEADQQLKEIDKSVGDSFRNVGNYEGAVEGMAKGFTSAKAELRALTNEILNMKKGTPEFEAARKRASELKDEIQDLSQELSAGAGNAFEQVSGSARLFGQRILDLDLKGAGAALTGMGNAVRGINFKTLREEIGGLVRGLGNLAKAVIANPYLMLAAAVALVIANFDDIIKRFPAIEKGLTGINQQERELLDIQTKRAEQAKKNYDNISAMEETLKFQGKTEKEIRDLKITAIQAAIEEAKVRLETEKSQAQAQIDASVRNRQILEGVIRWINAPLYLLLSTVDKIASWVGQTTNLAEGLTDLAADLLIDPNQVQADLQKSFEDQQNTIRDMQNSLDSFRNQQKKEDKDARDKAAKDAEKARDDAAKAEEEWAKKELERRKRENEEMLEEDGKLQRIEKSIGEEKNKAKITSEMEAHLKLTNLKAKNSKDALEKDKKAEQERQKELNDAVKAGTDLFVQQSERKQAQIDKELDNAKKQYDTLKALAENGNIDAQQSLAEQQRILDEKERQRMAEMKRQERIKLAQSIFSTYSAKLESGDKNALANTIKDATILTQFVQSLPAFLKGTEDTGVNGYGVDGKGGFLSVLHPNERVVPKELNSKMSGITNEELAKIAVAYKTNEFMTSIPAFQQTNSSEVVNELKSLKKAIEQKPETNISLGEIMQGAMEIVQTTKRGSKTVYNRYRVK